MEACATRWGLDIRRAFGNRIELAKILGSLLGNRPANDRTRRWRNVTAQGKWRLSPELTPVNPPLASKPPLGFGSRIFEILRFGGLGTKIGRGRLRRPENLAILRLQIPIS